MYLTLSQDINGNLHIINGSRGVMITADEAKWLFTYEEIIEAEIDKEKFRKAYGLDK